MAYIYVVDDDLTIREMLTEFFESRGHEINTYSSVENARDDLMNEQPDVLLLDVRLPGMDGLEFLSTVAGQLKDTCIIMMTGHADYHTAVQAIKQGARDFISKPFSLKDMDDIVEKALTDNKRTQQLQYLESANKQRVNDMVGASDRMQEVFRFIEKVASSPKTSVLIEGETGTGKGLVARAIHYQSARGDSPFIEVNCSAFQSSLLETELFGHERGAFTGANTRKKGLLELAHGGTFFLDEVGDMSLELQSKVLKVLEEQTFRRVGGTREIKIDTRIISATSKELQKAVQAGQFRTDLFYRLHVASIELPALRDRDLDIMMLADHYLMIFSLEFKKPIRGIHEDAKAVLLQHPWVGNVRELRNVIERAVLFEGSDILTLESIGISESVVHTDQQLVGEPTDVLNIAIPDTGLDFEEIERIFIIKALEKAGGNKSQAAKLLGFSRETMKYRLKKYGVGEPA